LCVFRFFDEKPKVTRRQSHKRKAEKVTKKESMKVIYERFLEFKVKQNLRPSSLNKLSLHSKKFEMFPVDSKEDNK